VSGHPAHFFLAKDAPCRVKGGVSLTEQQTNDVCIPRGRAYGGENDVRRAPKRLPMGKPAKDEFLNAKRFFSPKSEPLKRFPRFSQGTIATLVRCSKANISGNTCSTIQKGQGVKLTAFPSRARKRTGSILEAGICFWRSVCNEWSSRRPNRDQTAIENCIITSITKAARVSPQIHETSRRFFGAIHGLISCPLNSGLRRT